MNDGSGKDNPGQVGPDRDRSGQQYGAGQYGVAGDGTVDVLGSSVATAIGELDLPETDLVARVLDELAVDAANTTARSPRSGWGFGSLGDSLGQRRPALALAGSVLMVALALLVLEPARSAVADILGFGATRIEQSPDPSTTPTASDPLQTADSESDSEPESGSEANPAAAVDGPNPIPSLGTPSVEDGTTGRRRQYSWPASERFPALDTGSDTAEPGVILEVRTVTGPPDTKSLGGQPGTEFLTVTVESGEVLALWIPDDHLRTPVEGADAAPVGPTLLWTIDDLQFRLEADIDRDQAIALAAEVRGGTELLGAG